MEDPNFNPYQILHLNPSGVTPDEVKNAYRKMALLYHPDKCNGDDTVFNRIKNAYQMINNELKGKNNNYTYQSLKENFQGFTKTRQHVEQLSPKAHQKERQEFNLDIFNKKFIEAQKKTDIPMNLTEDDFKHKREHFFQDKSKIEEELKKVGKMFTTSRAFDRNIFNRQFEHLNGNKEDRSKEIAKFEPSEPLPIVSSNLEQFSSIYDGKQENDDYHILTSFGKLEQGEQLKSNPDEIDTKLSSKFCQEKDITTQEPVDQNIINQKIKEYKNIQILSQKAKNFLERRRD